MIITDIGKCGQYGIVYSDPPWPQTKGGKRLVRPNQEKKLDYDTMSLEDIKNFHLNFLALKTEPVHNVFMWTIDKYLHHTEKMMKELGYELHARLIWDKGNGIAPAFTVRFSHEYLLWFYRKGFMLKPVAHTRGKYTTVISEPAGEHSVKPMSAYLMLENMFPLSKKIELFARREVPGWDCWGDHFGCRYE